MTTRLRAEPVVLVVASAALLVLVVLPLGALLWGSVSVDGRLTLEHFRRALSSRLYVTALWNSLVLGGWTAVLSVAIGLPMAWAVTRTDVPGKRFIHLTATIAYITPPFLVAIAFVYLLSPNAGLVNRFIREQGPLNKAAPNYPLPRLAIGPLRAKTEALGRTDFSPLWSGQAAKLPRPVGARELTLRFAAETREALRELA